MTTQYRITGTADDWSHAADWQLGVVPAATDGAVIGPVSAPTDDDPASTAATGVVATGGSAIDGDGAYTIGAPAISTPPAEGYPASTATIGVDAIGSAIGDIGTTGDANRFKVTLAAGTNQGGHSGAGTAQRRVLSLLDSSGDGLIGNSGDGDSGPGRAGLNDRITYTAPTSGTYGLAAGPYTVSAIATSTVAPVLTTVASFSGSDGEYPQSSLIADANGDLFGTTPDGGANGDGTVFEIVNNGTLAAPNYGSTPTTVVGLNRWRGRGVAPAF